MIALWAVYTVAISVLFALIAECIDHAARATGLASRWAWVSAITASIAAPIIVNVFAAPRFPAVETGLAVTEFLGGLTVDQVFLIAWGAASLVAAATLVRSVFALRRDARTWRDGVVDGVQLRETAQVGPAAIGIRRMRIVIPSWVRTLDERSRSLVLLHELEHANARDPLLLVAAMLALVATPWNVALWWQVRRLRLAIEMDCDQRVLKRAPDARAYALLLLESSARSSARSFALRLSFATSPRSLEPRILAMTARYSPRRRVVVSAVACIGALITITVACDAPHPDPLSPRFGTATGELASDGAKLEFRTNRRDGGPRRPGDTVVLFTRGGRLKLRPPGDRPAREHQDGER
jgi:beta-lactamase regulating signal transducer with metallopeptidase domain